MTDTPIERQDQSAWTKLCRRKVVQWGIAFAAGAWGLLQGRIWPARHIGLAVFRDTQVVCEVARLGPLTGNADRNCF